MKMFDFRGYGGTPASVPLAKVSGLTKLPAGRGCELWVDGDDCAFVVTEPYDTIRQRLEDASQDDHG